MSTEASPARLLAAARHRRGLTQRALALRAGTSQAAISRIERGEEAPGFGRLSQLLLVMGERLELASTDIVTRAPEKLSPGECLREAVSWNLAATRLELAGTVARRAGHPATRRA